MYEKERTDEEVVRSLFNYFHSARQFVAGSIEYKTLVMGAIKKFPEDERSPKAFYAISRAELKDPNSTFEQVMDEYRSLGEAPNTFKGHYWEYYLGLTIDEANKEIRNLKKVR